MMDGGGNAIEFGGVVRMVYPDGTEEVLCDDGRVRCTSPDNGSRIGGVAIGDRVTLTVGPGRRGYVLCGSKIDLGRVMYDAAKVRREIDSKGKKPKEWKV
jgi:hypothetical protein